MLTREREEYYFAKSDLPLIPALDLEEILSNELWSRGKLTDINKEVIGEGLAFLDQALKGYELATGNIPSEASSIALPAYRALMVAIKAIRRNSYLVTFSLKDVLEKSRSVLQQLASEKYSQVKFKENSLKTTREFFLSLSKVPIDIEDRDFGL